MIVFGWGSGAKQLGTGFVTTCDNCNNTNPFVVVESSKKITVYWIPVAKWSKHYFTSVLYVHMALQYQQRNLHSAFSQPLSEIRSNLTPYSLMTSSAQ